MGVDYSSLVWIITITATDICSHHHNFFHWHCFQTYCGNHTGDSSRPATRKAPWWPKCVSGVEVWARAQELHWKYDYQLLLPDSYKLLPILRSRLLNPSNVFPSPLSPPYHEKCKEQVARKSQIQATETNGRQNDIYKHHIETTDTNNRCKSHMHMTHVPSYTHQLEPYHPPRTQSHIDLPSAIQCPSGKQSYIYPPTGATRSLRVPIPEYCIWAGDRSQQSNSHYDVTTSSWMLNFGTRTQIQNTMTCRTP